MLSTTLRLRRVAWGRRGMPAAIALGLVLVLVFAQTAAAQANPPLNFGNNYFVTGDYVVAGAQGLNASFGNDGLGTGIISFPDGNPGIRGTTTVPKGANILAALLYWQTVEKVGVPGSGQKGFFGPVFNGKAQLYPISGVALPIHMATSFSNGGCSGTSTGKQVQTYRTDVRGYLPLDANGNVLVDKADGYTFEVRLPNVGNNTPLALGATLVLIYRVISPNFPLNVITILDGAFAPNATPNFTMSQPVEGFYQAGSGLPSGSEQNPVSKLTHIVGAGKSNKFQAAFLSGGPHGIQSQRTAVPLPSPYGNGQPAFPGWYGNWDNTTWVFPDTNFPNVGNLANPLKENDDSANAMVVASGGNPGCVSWGAVIVATTVHDDDLDGILQVWKQNKQYTDVGTGHVVSLADPDPNNQTGSGHQDIFIQMDHVVAQDANGNPVDFAADASVAASTVTAAFLANNHNIHLHITQKNAIQEPACTDASLTPPQLCPYPNQPGITTWRDGFEFLKDQPLNLNADGTTWTEIQCEANPSTCVRRFPPAQRNSHHYVVFGDTLGTANWGLLGGGLTDSTGKVPGVVVQSSTTVTFYTSRGHGLTVNANAGNGRVTIANAMTNPVLNGTHYVHSVSCPMNDCSVDNKALGPYSFTILLTSAGTPPPTCPQAVPHGASCYTVTTDPYIAVASGQAGAGSGFSDVGGPGTLVTLGQWGALATQRAKAGTLMHELGHTLGLLHGGGDNDNCKSNYQSVMSYFFQSKLLGPNGVLDFSSQLLNPLDETKLGPITTTGSPIAFPTTRWYDQQTFAMVNGHLVPIGTPATKHCNGTPLSANDPLTGGYKGGTNSPLSTIVIPWLSLSSSFDINFDGKTPGTEVPSKFFGYNDWANVDLRQVGAGGNEYFTEPGGFVPGGPGGFVPGGPGGFVPGGPGGFVPGGPGGFVPGGPGGFVPGGPGGFVPGGPGAPVEIDSATSISTTDPPGTLTASEEVSPRVIDLSWPQSLDTTEKYNIYRSADNGATFSFLKSVGGTTAPPPNSTPVVVTSQDTVTCNPTGYKYFVTAVVLNTTVSPAQEQESTPTNTAPSSDPKLTGCYTIATQPNNVALTNFSFPAGTLVQGSKVPITWQLQDDDTSAFVNATAKNPLAANTLLAFGPFPHDQGCPTSLPSPPGMQPVTLLSNGIVQSGTGPFGTLAFGTFGFDTNNPNAFNFTWDTTNSGAGCYFFQLNLGSGQPGQTTVSALTLFIFVSDSSPHVITTTLPNAVVGSAYPNIPAATLQEAGGVPSFNWSVVVPGTGPLPSGITLGSLTGTLSGTTCQKGTYPFTAKVTDSLGNFGMQNLMLTVLPAAVAQINQPLNPESSVPGAAGFTLTVNGTGFDTCSAVQWSGTSPTTTFVSATQLTTTIPSSDVANPGTASISVANTGSPTSNVDFFQITNSTAGNVFLSPAGVATAVGLNPKGLISADFIGNGKLDLAIANSGDNTVSILLGNGDGTFTAKPVLSAGSVPYSLIAGDFNNDGKLDLAVVNYANGAASTVSVFIGNGDGTFKPAVSYAVGKGPYSVVTGDFNGDGTLDLAVANVQDHSVSILLGNGDGTFQTHVDYPAITSGAGALDVADLAVGDFNGDGRLDLAVTNPSTDQVSILFGNGDGTFQAPISYSTGAPGSHPIAVAVADFNNDGKLDLAVTNLYVETVAILLGNGTGTFTLTGSYSTTIGNMIGPSAIATGDFDGDGKVDLAITDQVDNSVSILVGNGDGSFQSPQEVNTGNFAAGVAVGDFNGDGRLDVAVANSTDDTISVMLQAPRVQLLPSPVSSFGSVVVSGPPSAPQVVTLTNTGSAALTISSSGIAFTGTNPGDFSQTNNCPMSPNTIAAGANCTISVTFAPTQAGARSASLSITDNATGSPQMVSVSGTGVLAPPTNLTANATAGTGSVSLNWTASTSTTVVGYNVYRSTTTGGPYTQIATAVAATSYTDTVASGTYYYVVAAVDASSNVSVKSNEAFATD